ncbi:energy transducer TonB [Ekhidna sp.]
MRAFIACLLLLIGQLVIAQIHVGYYHDLDKTPIHDYVDPIAYNPDEKLVLSHFSDSFEKGKIYYEDGTVAKGLIKYENKKIWYKKLSTDDKVKIKPEETIALTIGLDSFFVATNFSVEKSTGSITQKQPQFMQHLTSFDGKVYAKHYFFSSGMSSSVIETYQVRDENSTTWESFPRNKRRFREKALDYFDHIPYLKIKIMDQSISFADAYTLIKSAEYFHKFQNNETIYYDRYWNETEKENSNYKAIIKSLENDSIWTINYFKGDIPIYRAKYHALFPNKMHGAFERLDAEGQTLNVINYKKNEVKEKMVLYSNGKPHYVNKYRSLKYTYRTQNYLTYEAVYNSQGESLTSDGTWTEDVSWKQGQFTNEFEGNKLKRSYRDADGQRIHQITDPLYNFKIQKLQKLLDSYFAEKDFYSVANDHVQGTYFISVSINEKGVVSDYEIINQLHLSLDSKIRNWARRYLTGSYAVKFKPYKVNGQKVSAEFLIPLQFSILKFYRQPANGYDWMWHHQMMFHQQMMMQPMNLPTPPAPPGRF